MKNESQKKRPNFVRLGVNDFGKNFFHAAAAVILSRAKDPAYAVVITLGDAAPDYALRDSSRLGPRLGRGRHFGSG